MKMLKVGKAAGLDGVTPEHLNIGRNACSKGLVIMFSLCLHSNTVLTKK